MNKQTKFLIIIVGPTAVGKTSLAIELAKHYQTEIISADSRQFYKETNIGTAKPSAIELAEIPHHFINSLAIEENYTAAQFEKDAIKCIEKIHQNKDIAIMAGGSGLFVRAVTDGFDELPAIDPEIRKKLNQDFEKNGIEFLQQQLKIVDPEYFNQVDLANPQRIIRALEICIKTGKPFSHFRKNSLKVRLFNTIKIGLNIDRKILYDQINLRVDKMIQAGLVEEVSRLTLFKNLNALQTVGYKEIFEHLDGTVELPEAIDNIKQNTRRLAKRQLTWFRRDKEITWFEPDQVKLIVDFIRLKIFKPEQ